MGISKFKPVFNFSDVKNGNIMDLLFYVLQMHKSPTLFKYIYIVKIK